MAQWINNLPAMQETQEMQVRSLGHEDPLEQEMPTHSGMLAWKIPQTEEPHMAVNKKQTGLQIWETLGHGKEMTRNKESNVSRHQKITILAVIAITLSFRFPPECLFPLKPQISGCSVQHRLESAGRVWGSHPAPHLRVGCPRV